MRSRSVLVGLVLFAAGILAASVVLSKLVFDAAPVLPVLWFMAMLSGWVFAVLLGGFVQSRRRRPGDHAPDGRASFIEPDLKPRGSMWACANPTARTESTTSSRHGFRSAGPRTDPPHPRSVPRSRTRTLAVWMPWRAQRFTHGDLLVRPARRAGEIWMPPGRSGWKDTPPGGLSQTVRPQA